MRRRPRSDWQIVTGFLCGLSFALGTGGWLVFADDSVTPRTTVDASWNAVFDRRDGWTGADCAGTVNLGDGRILWMFGDTWIGPLRGGKRQPGSTMVNNSIAVHPLDRSAPWTAPDPTSVRFVWGPGSENGKPIAWAVPRSETANQLSTDEAREWLWANGGGVAVDTAQGTRRLFVFFFRVRPNRHGVGVWAFAVAGTTLGIVDNASEPVERWKLRLLDLPFCPQTTATASRPSEAKVTWGMAVCLDPDSPHRESPDALIYGIRKSALLNDSLILARAPSIAIDQFQSWRFYAGNNAWSTQVGDAKPIAEGLVSEFSVEPMTEAGREKWILVQSEPLLGKHIFVRTAPKPLGPWSPRVTVATVPDVKRSRSYFTYAAKGHSALSRPGELLITYLVNSQNFGDLVTDTSIYRPHFLRLSLSAIVTRQIPRNR